jgi:hypothetical protein
VSRNRLRSRLRRPVLAGVAAALVVTTAIGGNIGQAVGVKAQPAPAKITKQQLAKFEKKLAARATRYASDKPVGPNPATSLVPPGKPRDYQGWAEAAAKRAAKRAALRDRAAKRAQGTAAARQAAVAPITARESEPKGSRGSNDSQDNAENLPGFGTGQGNPKATLLGNISPEAVPESSLVKIKPNKEDDGSPELARDTGVANKQVGIKTTGFRGDAPGKTPEERAADLDYYKLTLTGNERVTARMVGTSGNLEPIMTLADENLNFVGDTFFEDIDNDVELSVSVPTGGTYYLVTAGWYVIDLGGGPSGDTTGKYSLSLSAGEDDRDVWAVDLKAGDILGATLDSPGYVSIAGPDGTETQRSPFDNSFIYPLDSPLPGANGYPVSDYVAPTDGRYFVEYGGGEGAYAGNLEVYRYGGEGKQKQTVFLDTDGARVNTRIWGGGFGVVNLSPLSSFLGKWGLKKSQEPALVDTIKANLKENLKRDFAETGLSDTVDIKVVSSLDGPDLTGKPGVTRIILGGTIDESGIGTIGIAESIDPGNFARTETGLVLLDLLSDPGNVEDAPYSLNSYLSSGSDRAGFVAQGLGNVASHEVGHMIGNWHTELSNETDSLMDAGGNFPQLFGVGPDKVGGTADDRDVDFVQDTYDLFEGFIGTEDTTARSTWALSR